MIVVLLGPPGSGKGTQGERLSAALGIPKLSTGDTLRAAAAAGTPLGLEAKGYMDRGDLVPDPVILGIIGEALNSPQYARGALLDGVVRTVAQAEGLAQATAAIGKRVDRVLLFEIGDELLVQRLSARTTCDRCGKPFMGMAPGQPCPDGEGTLVRRQDDEPDAIRNRLRVYQAQTAPVVDWYRTHGADLRAIDAVGTLDEVWGRVEAAVRG